MSEVKCWKIYVYQSSQRRPSLQVQINQCNEPHTKNISRILSIRAHKRITPEIRQGGRYFVKDKRTTNLIFIRTMKIKMTMPKQKKMISSIPQIMQQLRKELCGRLATLDLYGKYMRTCPEPTQEANRLHMEEKSEGCVFSPDRFNHYTEETLRECKVLPAFFTGGHIFNNIIYAD